MADARDPRDPRDEAARAADHAGIDRLAEALVPALMAKLGSLNIGELEVREGDWKIRLRRPAGGAGGGPMYGRRSTDKPSRSHPGHEQHGHAPGAPERHREPRGGTSATVSSNGRETSLAPVGPGRGGDGMSAGPADANRVAASPAVGVFQPDPKKAVAGTRVRAGDRLGVVDMLGVPQEVVAPADGIVVGVIVEAGTAVEYGQDLIQLEPSAAPAEAR